MEFKKEDLFIEKSANYVPDNDSLMETKEISLVLNEDNQYRKYYLMSSGSLRLNIARTILTASSLILLVNVIPCDLVDCLILSGVGLSLVFTYNLLSLYHSTTRIPKRMFAQLMTIEPREFIVERYVEYNEAPKPWVDAQRQFLAYGKIKCPIDIYANEGTIIDLPNKEKMVDPILGEFFRLEGSELLKLKPESHEMEQAFLFLKMVDNLKEGEKRKVHLFVGPTEYSYHKLPFRIFLKSKEQLKLEREEAWRQSEIERIKRTQEENKRRHQENVDINARKRAEVLKMNDQIAKRNKELIQECKNKQDVLDDQYISEVNKMVDAITLHGKKISLAKLILLIINLAYSCLVFIYRTDCGSRYCGYTSLPINLIIPFEIYLWLQYSTRLEMSSGQENIDKNVVVRDASSNFKTRKDHLKLGVEMSWNKPMFDFFDR